jgi:excisionase family DNA binding protein
MFNPPNEQEYLLRPDEVARILRISRAQVYKLLRSDIPVFQVGIGSVRISPIDLERYLARIRDAHGQEDDQ